MVFVEQDVREMTHPIVREKIIAMGVAGANYNQMEQHVVTGIFVVLSQLVAGAFVTMTVIPAVMHVQKKMDIKIVKMELVIQAIVQKELYGYEMAFIILVAIIQRQMFCVQTFIMVVIDVIIMVS